MNNFYIPSDAVKITYQVGGMAVAMPYFVWPADNKFQWSAGGNCGEESTREMAETKAKFWLRYGQELSTAQDRAESGRS